MKISNDVEIIEGLPVLYIKRLSVIVCSDLHFGYEGVMADRGTFLPKVNLKNIEKTIGGAVEATGAERIIIDGDIKNEFSGVHREEFNEFNEFVIYLRQELGMKAITLVKGNHDNFVDRLKEPFKIEIYRQEALIGGVLFFHGEELPHSREGRLLVMGHLHPAIALYNNLGVKEKLKAFLYGSMKDGRKVIVLPAMNYFAEGVGVNSEDVRGMAPIFNKMLNVDKMRAFCIGEGEILDFGSVKELRKAAAIVD